ncbi:MAG: hypothetical protein ACKVP5_06465 [Aestuariivirga sp.]
MKKLASTAVALMLIAATASSAEAITKVRFILKSKGGAEVAEKIAHFSLGNCLPLEAVSLTGDSIAVAMDCDTVAYAVKAVGDIMSGVEGAGELLTIGFTEN